ncbi:IclR family transcriptional regulator [Streptomyces sp. NPDC059917]|uniref:IclR family transcriptional regulator n=1 Tax=Streptomyces sp. NPDC059917 TaxID=3347002 RepID=UPI00366418BC
MNAIRTGVAAPRSADRAPAAGSALEKTLRIMEALAAPGGPHRLGSVAASSGVPKSSTYRVLVSLVEQGYAVTDGEGGYGMGLQLRTLAAQVGADRPEGIVRLLEFLQRSTGQSVHLALYDGGSGLTCVRKAESDRAFRTSTRVGTRLPLHASAIGKAVLAHLPGAEVEALALATGLAPMTRRTITTVERLADELVAVRARGYALDHEENEVSVRCMAAPVFDRDGAPIGGLGLSTVTFLTSGEELEAYAPALLEAARGVERLLQRG